MNTELSKKAKNDFEKDFFKLMNDSLGKCKKSQRTEVIKLLAIEKKKKLFGARTKLSWHKVFDR